MYAGRTYFKKGHPFFKSENTHLFKKGSIPWSKGRSFPCESYPVYGMRNRHHSDETKLKISLSRIGKHYPSLSLAKKGQTPFMKGKHHSEEAKKKLSKSHKGIPRTTPIWNKGKTYEELYGKEKASKLIGNIIERMSGEKSPNWKGGATSATQRRIRKASWLKLSKEIRERDNNTCRRCGIQRINPPLSVHHLIPFRISANDSPTNLIAVCGKCHTYLDHQYIRLGYVTRFLKNMMVENVARSRRWR